MAKRVQMSKKLLPYGANRNDRIQENKARRDVGDSRYSSPSDDTRNLETKRSLNESSIVTLPDHISRRRFVPNKTREDGSDQEYKITGKDWKRLDAGNVSGSSNSDAKGSAGENEPLMSQGTSGSSFSCSDFSMDSNEVSTVHPLNKRKEEPRSQTNYEFSISNETPMTQERSVHESVDSDISSFRVDSSVEDVSRGEQVQERSPLIKRRPKRKLELGGRICKETRIRWKRLDAGGVSGSSNSDAKGSAGENEPLMSQGTSGSSFSCSDFSMESNEVSTVQPLNQRKEQPRSQINYEFSISNETPMTQERSVHESVDSNISSFRVDSSVEDVSRGEQVQERSPLIKRRPKRKLELRGRICKETRNWWRHLDAGGVSGSSNSDAKGSAGENEPLMSQGTSGSSFSCSDFSMERNEVSTVQPLNQRKEEPRSQTNYEFSISNETPMTQERSVHESVDSNISSFRVDSSVEDVSRGEQVQERSPLIKRRPKRKLELGGRICKETRIRWKRLDAGGVSGSSNSDAKGSAGENEPLMSQGTSGSSFSCSDFSMESNEVSTVQPLNQRKEQPRSQINYEFSISNETPMTQERSVHESVDSNISSFRVDSSVEDVSRGEQVQERSPLIKRRPKRKLELGGRICKETRIRWKRLDAGGVSGSSNSDAKGSAGENEPLMSQGTSGSSFSCSDFSMESNEVSTVQPLNQRKEEPRSQINYEFSISNETPMTQERSVHESVDSNISSFRVDSSVEDVSRGEQVQERSHLIKRRPKRKLELRGRICKETRNWWRHLDAGGVSGSSNSDAKGSAGENEPLMSQGTSGSSFSCSDFSMESNEVSTLQPLNQRKEGPRSQTNYEFSISNETPMTQERSVHESLDSNISSFRVDSSVEDVSRGEQIQESSPLIKRRPKRKLELGGRICKQRRNRWKRLDAGGVSGSSNSDAKGSAGENESSQSEFGGYFESTPVFIVLDAKSPFSRINKDFGDVSSIHSESFIAKNPVEEFPVSVSSVKGHGSPNCLKASKSVADVDIIRHNSNHASSYEMVNPIALSSHHQEIIDIPSHSLSQNSDLKIPVMGPQPPSPDKMILPDGASMGIEVGETPLTLSLTSHVSKAGLSSSKLLSPSPYKILHASEQGLPGANLIADMKETQQASISVTIDQSNVIPSTSKAFIELHDSSQVPVLPTGRRYPRRSSVRGISATPMLSVTRGGKKGAVSTVKKKKLESHRPASSTKSKLNRLSTENLPSVDKRSYTSSNRRSSGEKHVPFPAEKSTTPSQTESHSTYFAPKSHLLAADDKAPYINLPEGQMSERAANHPSPESEVIHLEKSAEAIFGINFAFSTCHSVSEEIKLNLPSPSKDINGHHLSTEEIKSTAHSLVKDTTRDKSGNLFTSTKIIEKVSGITSSSESMSAPNEPRASSLGKKRFKYSNLTFNSELVKSVASKSSSISSIDAESEPSCSYASKDESSASTEKDRKKCDESKSPKPEDDVGRIVDNILRKLDEACEQHRKQEMEKAQSTVQQFAALLRTQHNLGKRRKLESCARGQPPKVRRKKGPSEQPATRRGLPAWCSKSVKKMMVEAMESREMPYLDQEEFLFRFVDTVKLVMKSKDASEVQDGVISVQRQLFDLNIVFSLGDFFQFVRNYLPYEFRCRSIPCSGWNDPLYATWVDDSDLKRPLFE